MNWLKKMSQGTVPNVLYHATYAAYADSILQKGLIPRYICVWEDCEYGVYLASDPHVAQSFPETTDNPEIPDEYLDEIVVFAVNTNMLDKSRLQTDPNIIREFDDDPVYAWIYLDIIPVTAISNADQVRSGGSGFSGV